MRERRESNFLFKLNPLQPCTFDSTLSLKNSTSADPPFSCPLTFFFGDRDARVPEGVARGWERYCEGGAKAVDEEDGEDEEKASAATEGEEETPAAAAVAVVKSSGNFELVRVKGARHLWPLDRRLKARWLFEIASRMARDLGLPGPEEEE